MKKSSVSTRPEFTQHTTNTPKRRTDLSLHCFAWMVVLEPGTGRVGAAKTGSFPLPMYVRVSGT